jgi:putative spermidine/putrescine transport system permease protein
MSADSAERFGAPSGGAGFFRWARWSTVVLVTPLTLFLFFLFILPLVNLILGNTGQLGAASPWSLYGKFFVDPFYRGALENTLVVGVSVTAIALLCGYPLALWLSRAPAILRKIGLMMVVFPILVPGVISTFGWQAMLARRGPIELAVESFGLFGDVEFADTRLGVIIALAGILIPYMVLTLIAVLEGVDRQLEQAAQDLGCNAVTAFFRVTLPLTVNGIVGGSLLIFVLAISNFATASLVGGGRVNLVSTAIYRSIVSLDLPAATVLSSFLMVISMAITLIYSRLLRTKAMN